MSFVSVDYGDGKMIKWMSDTNGDPALDHFSPILRDGEKDVPLTLELIRQLPDDAYGNKDGYVYKGDVSLTSWTKRYIIICGGMLVYFKNNSTSKPQGVIPLQDCVVELPNDNRASFALKGRQGVEGFEMRITHHVRRPFIVVFTTSVEREEWRKYLIGYIFFTFLSNKFPIAERVIHVDECLMLKKKVKNHGESDLLPSFKNHQRWVYMEWAGADMSKWGISYSHQRLARLNGCTTSAIDSAKLVLIPCRSITKVVMEPFEHTAAFCVHETVPGESGARSLEQIWQFTVVSTSNGTHAGKSASELVSVAKQWVDSVNALLSMYASIRRDQNQVSEDKAIALFRDNESKISQLKRQLSGEDVPTNSKSDYLHHGDPGVVYTREKHTQNLQFIKTFDNPIKKSKIEYNDILEESKAELVANASGASQDIEMSAGESIPTANPNTTINGNNSENRFTSANTEEKDAVKDMNVDSASIKMAPTSNSNVNSAKAKPSVRASIVNAMGAFGVRKLSLHLKDGELISSMLNDSGSSFVGGVKLDDGKDVSLQRVMPKDSISQDINVEKKNKNISLKVFQSYEDIGTSKGIVESVPRHFDMEHKSGQEIEEEEEKHIDNSDISGTNLHMQSYSDPQHNSRGSEFIGKNISSKLIGKGGDEKLTLKVEYFSAPVNLVLHPSQNELEIAREDTTTPGFVFCFRDCVSVEYDLNNTGLIRFVFDNCDENSSSEKAPYLEWVVRSREGSVPSLKWLNLLEQLQESFRRAEAVL